MAEHDAQILAELKKQTDALARWEGTKGLFGGLMLGVLGGIVLAVMTVDTKVFPLTAWAPIVLPVLLGWAAYKGSYDSIAKPPQTQQKVEMAGTLRFVCFVGAALIATLVYINWH